ncbi:MAG: ABC transporter ATP-binding protein [Myxococcota bacterium]|nr:ABC transporter ATP-binding protein [Myxococcota bacterium]
MREAPWAALWGLLQGSRGALLLGAVAAIISRLASLAFPPIVAEAMDAGLRGEPETTSFTSLALLLAAVILAQAVATWTFAYLSGVIGSRVVNRQRSLIFGRLLQMTPEWLSGRSRGELVGRLAADGEAIRLMSPTLLMSTADIVKAACGIVLLVVTAPYLALWVSIVLPLSLLVVVLANRGLGRRGRGLRDAEAAASNHVESVLTSFWTVKAFARERAEAGAYDERLAGVQRAVSRFSATMATFQSALYSTSGLVFLVLVAVGARSLADGELSAGRIVAFLMYAFLVAESVIQLSHQSGAMASAVGATTRLLELARLEPTDLDAPDATPAPSTGGVAIEDLEIAYDSGVPVLSGASLRVEPGELIGLVGRSGAGKSTLVAALLRFLEPRRGRILLGGQDIASLSKTSLRRAVAVVPQDPALFPTSILENIRYGDPTASLEAVEDAARRAHAHDFITALPGGYDAPVGDRGSKLSGGQRQRIALARALLADPSVLILDEATSSQDAESEAAIEAAITAFARTHAVIVIAHRLQTLMDATRIYVLDGGAVAEVGTHEELLTRSGLYQHLYAIQDRRSEP